MAAEDALTDVLEGLWSSPPLKHPTINFCNKKIQGLQKNSLHCELWNISWTTHSLIYYDILWAYNRLTCKVLLISGSTSMGKHCKEAKSNENTVFEDF